MNEELENKLDQLQIKYPQLVLRALRIEDRDWTFTFSACREAATLTINGHFYKGIMYQRIVHDRSETLDPNSLTVELIVDEDEFLKSGALAMLILNSSKGESQWMN